MGKIHNVIDTNVLLSYPDSLDKFDNIILPIQVLEEIDKIKKGNEDINYKARQVSKRIEANMDKIDFITKDTYGNVPEGWDANKNDNKIVMAAFNSGSKIISNDLNVRLKAQALDIECEKYDGLCSVEDIYKGYREVTMSDTEMASFYESRSNNFDLYNGEYLLIKNVLGEIVDKLKWTEQGFKNLDYKVIDNSYLGKIKPRNIQQELLFDLLQNKNTTVKVCTGKFGAGKDFCMISNAMNLIQKGKYDKLIWVRNNIQVKNTKDIGFLPGTADEKLLPFAMVLADHVGGQFGLELLIKEKKIELQHLGFMRGRDIKNAIVYCTEAENMTKEHIQLLMGRLAENSILYLNGDYKQVDDKVFEQNSGLNRVIEKLKGHKNFGYVHLEKTERSETAAMADLLD